MGPTRSLHLLRPLENWSEIQWEGNVLLNSAKGCGYPIARRVRVQAIAAAEAADGKLSIFQERTWLIPAKAEATPTAPAIKANVTKKPVAAFPIGKYMGEK